MDFEALRQLALDVSAEDIAVSRDARRQLAALLTPSQILAWLSSPDTAEALAVLVGEVEAAANPDVYHLLGASLRGVLTTPSDDTQRALFAPTARFLLAFIVSTAAAAETSLAAAMLDALRLLMLTAAAHAEAAAAVGAMLDAQFCNDRVLRLFDCDHIESDDNASVCAFLAAHTSLLSFLLTATAEAFASDPLLLANYLVASGVVCRTVAVPSALRRTLMGVLRAHDDPLYYAFVCRFWGIALLRHEANGSRDAVECVVAVLPVVEGGERDEGATEAAFDVLGAAASTQAGWDCLASRLRWEPLTARLRSTSASLRLSTLNLLLAMLSSAHAVPSFFTKDVLLDAWQTRTTPDDEVRLALWRVVLTALRVEELATVLAAACASFICSGAYEENITVRTMKLQAATALIQRAALPETVQSRLKEFVGRGLYPAGSSGVSLMTKD